MFRIGTLKVLNTDHHCLYQVQWCTRKRRSLVIPLVPAVSLVHFLTSTFNQLQV